MRIAGTILWFLGVTGCGGLSMEHANAKAAPNTGFLVRTVKVDGNAHKYGVFIPHGYNPRERWPVIVFLHGILQAGSNGTGCMGVGLGPAVADRAATFPFIVIFPQSSGDWKGDARTRLVIACLDQVRRDYSTDPDRVILTGLSDGGYGAWAIGATYANRFSALVPMCAYTDFADVPRLKGIPIWCFHNSGDFLVSPGGSEEMCRRIREAGGNVRFTEYAAFGHDCWDRAYNEGELFDWMLAQRRAGSHTGPTDR